MNLSNRADELEGPDWLRARRAEAAIAADLKGWPTTELEHWRYTPVSELDFGSLAVGPATSAPPGALPPGPADIAAAAVLRIVDGRLAHHEVSDAKITVAVNPPEELTLSEPPDRDGLADLHDALVGEIVHVSVAPGAVVDRPLLVVYETATAGTASFPHVVVDVGEQAEVTLVEWFVSSAARGLVDVVSDVRASAAANVRHVAVQQQARGVNQTGYLLLSAQRDATVRSWYVALGGGYARVYVGARLAGQGSTVDISGVYFAEEDQVHDFRSLQDLHGARASTTFVLKGTATDKAHGIYTGVIRVHKGAKATSSSLTNRNLVLGAEARVDSVPNLEIIDENDLRSCGHAAATEPVDPEHVFYLESRGVPTNVAERLVVGGFLEEVVAGIPVDAVRSEARRVLAARLDRVEGAGG